MRNIVNYLTSTVMYYLCSVYKPFEMDINHCQVLLTEGIRIIFTVVGVYAKMGERVLTLSMDNSFF